MDVLHHQRCQCLHHRRNPFGNMFCPSHQWQPLQLGGGSCGAQVRAFRWVSSAPILANAQTPELTGSSSFAAARDVCGVADL